MRASLLGVPLRVTPMNARRVANLKANRRGYVSLIVFLVLFGLSLAANLLASDKPVLVRYDGCSANAAAAGNDPAQASACPRWYFPLFVDYPETEFGGFLPTPTDFTFSFVREQIQAHGWMVYPPIPFTYDTVVRELPGPAPSPPCWTIARAPDQPSACSVSPNLLGTDDQGRDVLARVIYGFRISVLFGLALTLLSSLVGILMGAVQGYFGGWVDLGLQRFMEIWAGMPTLYLLIIMSSLIIPGFWSLLILMLLFSWMALVDLVRAEFLRARNFDFVRAARGLGVSDWTIMRRHVLPNAMVSSLTFMPFILNGSITTLTSLDFLGFGLPVGSPSLGELLLQGKNNLHAPWLGLSGFFVIAIMLSLLVFVGEAVRDAFDPRKTFQAAAPLAEPSPALLDQPEPELDEPPRAAAGGQS